MRQGRQARYRNGTGSESPAARLAQAPEEDPPVNTRNKIRILAAVLFGAVVAVFAVSGSDHVGMVAAIGGIALGLFYVVTGVFGQPARSRR